MYPLEVLPCLQCWFRISWYVICGVLFNCNMFNMTCEWLSLSANTVQCTINHGWSELSSSNKYTIPCVTYLLYRLLNSSLYRIRSYDIQPHCIYTLLNFSRKLSPITYIDLPPFLCTPSTRIYSNYCICIIINLNLIIKFLWHSISAWVVV